MSKTYLNAFFSEKQISYTMFEIVDENGLTHFIDTDYVTSAILNAPLKEQQVICQTLRKLDYFNQPINDYLKHLATALVNRYKKAA